MVSQRHRAGHAGHRLAVDRRRDAVAGRPLEDVQGQPRPPQRPVGREADAEPGLGPHHLPHLDQGRGPLGSRGKAVSGSHP